MSADIGTEQDYQDAESALRRKDFPLAFKLYLKLASGGREDCFAMLGWLYFAGKGTVQDFAAARTWLVRSADLGDAQGQFYLAKLCWHEREPACVIRWLDAASKLEYPPAFFRLGRLYEDGVFVKRDFLTALRYYREAAFRGHLVGENRHALLLLLGKGGRRAIPLALWSYLRSIVRMVRQAAVDPESDSLRV